MKLGNDCINNKCSAPTECEKHNAVYNILHYLVDAEFIKINVSFKLSEKIFICRMNLILFRFYFTGF